MSVTLPEGARWEVVDGQTYLYPPPGQTVSEMFLSMGRCRICGRVRAACDEEYCARCRATVDVGLHLFIREVLFTQHVHQKMDAEQSHL